MSTIGIFDADINKYIHVPFNLEVMKLAAYYKHKHDVVAAARDFSPDKYTTFIYRKDYNDGDFPQALYQHSNIEYGGLSFSDKYVPLDESIEILKPNTNFYLPFKDSFSTSERYYMAFHVMKNAQHLRLSLDEKTIWNKYSSQINDLSRTNTLFIHDKDITQISGAADCIKDMMKEMPNSQYSHILGLKYPIYAKTEDEVLTWLQFTPAQEYYTIQYQGLLSDEVYSYLVQSDYSNKVNRYFECNITANIQTEDDFSKKILPKIYKQIIFSRFYHQKILLKYDTNFFINPLWHKVIDLLNGYAVSLFKINKEKYNKIILDDSLFSFVNALPENPIIKDYPFTKQDAREAFQLVREKNYEVFKDFYECHQVELKGGEFVNVAR